MTLDFETVVLEDEYRLDSYVYNGEYLCTLGNTIWRVDSAGNKVILYKGIEKYVMLIDIVGGTMGFIEGQLIFGIHRPVSDYSLHFQLPMDFGLVLTTNQFVIGGRRIESGEYEFAFINIDGVIKWSFLGNAYTRVHYTSGNVLVCITDDGKTINGRSKESGAVLWERTFTSYLDIEAGIFDSTLIEYAGKIYISSRRYDNSSTFCIDPSSGEVLSSYPGMPGKLLESDGVLYSIRVSRFLVMLDLETNTLSEWDMSDLLMSNDFRDIDYRWQVKNNILYIPQNIGDVKARLMLVDIKNRCMLWKHVFPGKRGGVGGIAVMDNSFCVNMQDFSVHLFKRK